MSAVWFPAQVMLHTVVAATAATPTLFLLGRKTSEPKNSKRTWKKNKCRLCRKFLNEYYNNHPWLWPLVRFSSELAFSNVLCRLHLVFLSTIFYIYVAWNMEGCLPSNILCNHRHPNILNIKKIFREYFWDGECSLGLPCTGESDCHMYWADVQWFALFRREWLSHVLGWCSMVCPVQERVTVTCIGLMFNGLPCRGESDCHVY